MNADDEMTAAMYELDCALLDWAQKNEAWISKLSNGKWGVWVHGKGDFEGKDIREALETAMKGCK